MSNNVADSILTLRVGDLPVLSKQAPSREAHCYGVMLATVRGLPLPVSQRDDGAAIESLAVLGCMFNNEKGGWQWVQLSPGFKELIGDIMMENHFQRDVWHSMKLHREGDREVVKALGKHGEEEEA